MSLITVRNKSAAVQVLKCLGLAPLRLFPGYNQVDEGDFKKYMKGNKAAQGMAKEHLRPVESPTKDQEKEAAKAAEKNVLLNKSKKIIQKGAADLKKSEKVNAEQSATIKEQGDTIAKLMKRLDALEKVDPDPKKKDK